MLSGIWEHTSELEKSLLLPLKQFLPFLLFLLLVILLRFYRSGLWRQKTLAWLSPDAVTATDASLKRENIKITGQRSNLKSSENWCNVGPLNCFVANCYLLMVKSRISAVWPRYSDTMPPERASHSRSAPSRQQVDTTEEESSHCRWTMPAWENTEGGES